MNDTCENCQHMGKSTSGYVGMYCKYTGEAVDGDMNCVDWEAKKPPLRAQIEQMTNEYDFDDLALEFMAAMGELTQTLAVIVLEKDGKATLMDLKDELADVQLRILQTLSWLDMSDKEFEKNLESELEIL